MLVLLMEEGPLLPWVNLRAPGLSETPQTEQVLDTDTTPALASRAQSEGPEGSHVWVCMRLFQHTKSAPGACEQGQSWAVRPSISYAILAVPERPGGQDLLQGWGPFIPCLSALVIP